MRIKTTTETKIRIFVHVQFVERRLGIKMHFLFNPFQKQ